MKGIICAIVAIIILFDGFMSYVLCKASGIRSKEEENWDSDYILGINKNEENKS